MKDMISRRNFFKTGAVTVGGLSLGAAAAQLCSQATGDQPLGPFFPRPNTPIDPIRENPDPNTPIYLANDSDLTRVTGRNGNAKGQIAYVHGRLTNGDCAPIAGATIIIWQASESGRYNHLGDSANESFEHPKTGDTIHRELDNAFQYWGKATTSPQGDYIFKTIIPGFYPADLENGWYRPPHIHFLIAATGYPQLVTQMYFKGETIANNDFIQELNQQDLILQSEKLSEAERQALVVNFEHSATSGEFNGELVGRFDINIPG